MSVLRVNHVNHSVIAPLSAAWSNGSLLDKNLRPMMGYDVLELSKWVTTRAGTLRNPYHIAPQLLCALHRHGLYIW